jgi:hypothetical protein
MCCGCHRHKAQKGLTRAGVDAWRARHALEPIDDAQWRRQFERARRPVGVQRTIFEILDEGPAP